MPEAFDMGAYLHLSAFRDVASAALIYLQMASTVQDRPKVRAYSFKGSLKVVTHSAMKATQATIMIQPAVVM